MHLPTVPYKILSMKFIKSAIPFIIFTLLAILLYHKVLDAPFILDDNWYIENNYKIKNLSTFITDFSGTRYIGFLTFAINYYFNGLNTYGYHVANILIHILNTSLVYLLIQITLNRLKTQDSKLETQNFELLTINYLPFTVSLIFLVHPIQTQAVSYISQRFTSLATFFYLLAIVLYVKSRLNCLNRLSRLSRFLTLYTLSILSAILAMKTKEISFTLPFIILLYEFTFLNNPLNPPLLRGNNRPLPPIFYLLPFFLTLILIPLSLFGSDLPIEGYSGADKKLIEAQLRDIRGIPAYIYLLTQFRVIITYIRLLFIPINQHFEYDYPLSNYIFEPATFISFVVLLLIFGFGVYLFIRSRKTHHAHGLLVSFGILWFFVTLSVESSIIPIKDVISEHRLYLPSVGFILSVTTGIFYGRQIEDLRLKAKILSLQSGVLSLFLTVFIITCIFSFTTYKRNVLWGDSFLLSLDEVKKSPNSPMPHINLGLIYHKKGLVDKAVEHFKIVLNLWPDFIKTHNNIGIIYFNELDADKAMEYYQNIIKLNPYDSEGHNNLGNIYYKKGLLDTAIEHYNIAIRWKPDFIEAHNNLGAAYQIKGLLDKAVEHYQIAIKLKPGSPEIHFNLGSAYYGEGLIDNAIEHYKIAIRLKPDNPKAHYTLGNAYYKKARLDEAINEFQTAIKLKPDYIDAYKMIEEIKRK